MLKFPSIQAARKALLRGTFPIPMTQMPPRRGWYTTPKTVAAFLDTLDVSPQKGTRGSSICAKESAMT